MSPSLLTSKLVSDNKTVFRTAAWFYRDFVVRYALRLFWITTLGFSAASLQAAALFGLNHILKEAGGNRPMEVPLLDLQVSADDIATMGGLFILLAVGAAAFLALFESRAIYTLWRRYQMHALDALMFAVQNACCRNAMTFETLEVRSFRRLLSRVQKLGAFSRVVAASIAPALRFIAFSAYAVIASPLLTIALLLAFIPSAGLTVLFFARRASRCSRAVIDLSAEEARELDQRLEEACQGRYVPLERSAAHQNSAIQRRVKALVGRLLWVEYSRFLTTVITIFVLGLFLVLVETSELFGSEGWAGMLTYAIALYLAFRQLIVMASSVSAFGRFYPAVTRQMKILESLENATSAGQFWRVLAKAGIAPDSFGEDEQEVA